MYMMVVDSIPSKVNSHNIDFDVIIWLKTADVNQVNMKDSEGDIEVERVENINLWCLHACSMNFPYKCKQKICDDKYIIYRNWVTITDDKQWEGKFGEML